MIKLCFSDRKNREGEEQSLECGRIARKLEGKKIIFSVFFLIMLCVIAINGMEDHFSEIFSTVFVLGKKMLNKSPLHQNSNFVNEEITDLKLSWKVFFSPTGERNRGRASE